MIVRLRVVNSTSNVIGRLDSKLTNDMIVVWYRNVQVDQASSVQLYNVIVAQLIIMKYQDKIEWRK